MSSTEEPNNDLSGFLFLECCEISIHSDSCAVNVETLLDTQQQQQWVQVDFSLQDDDNNYTSNDIESGQAESKYCSHCRLDLCLTTANDSATITATHPYSKLRLPPGGAGSACRFDGMVDNVQPHPDFCTCSKGHRKRTRTDAALLLGLAMTCQDLGHVHIQSIRILLLREHDNHMPKQNGRPCNVESTGTPTVKHFKAALVITLSIPEVRINGRSATPPWITMKKYITSSSKPLPQSTQLLLAIIRSDWAVLQNALDYPDHFIAATLTSKQQLSSSHINPSNNNNNKSLSFFPVKLSLDQVYQRIGSAESHLYNFYRPHGNLETTTTTTPSSPPNDQIGHVGLCHLPKDLLHDHIAPFFRAKSLHALTCCNKYLHSTLQGFVPGLKLRLYRHQIKSLSWMRQREIKQITEDDMMKRSETTTKTTTAGCEMDMLRVASGGSSVLLHSAAHTVSESTIRKDNDKEGNVISAVRISQCNGEEETISHKRHGGLPRRVARGGLLCDDPGLGKTITVLSLILQTLGLSTEKDNGTEATTTAKDSKKDLALQQKADDELIFSEYWKEESISTYRSQAMTKLLNSFVRCNDLAILFMLPTKPDPSCIPDDMYTNTDPTCIVEIRGKIDREKYDASFDTFHDDVLLLFSNTMKYHPRESRIHEAAKQLRQSWIETVEEFKQKQVKIAKKSFARIRSKPNSSVAVLVEKYNHSKLNSSLIQSSATLLVVPNNLVEHWQEQIRLHLNDAYFVGTGGTIHFEYRGTHSEMTEIENITRRCNHHACKPFLFVDKAGTKRLPPPEFLAMFSLVITTNQRFTTEWKNGSYQDELRRLDTNFYEARDDFNYNPFSEPEDETCPLVKVKWLRMIVDEGHSMGRGRDSSAIAFASWIEAERLWAMTGTPTRQTISQTGLANIHNLLQYLKHDFFVPGFDGEMIWQSLISRGWNKGALSSFFRLRDLLSLLMVRHTKNDIQELPPPQYISTILSMSAEETKTYNTLVCAVQSNLLITSMKGKTSGLQDSLLHRSQARHARDALRNVRLVCAGGTQVVPTVTPQFWDEFLQDFKECNKDPVLFKKMKNYLEMATTEQLTPCDCCGTLLTTQLVFPCGDLVCTECADPTSTTCIVCNKEFDVDIFQRLQPGMDYQWLHNIEEETKKKKKTSDTVAQAGSVELLENGRGMLAPQDQNRHRRRTARPSDGHVCAYSPKNVNGECELCWREHDACDLLVPSMRCKVCYRVAEHCPEFETKPYYVVQKLLRLGEEQMRQQSLQNPKTSPSSKWFAPHEKKLVKVIVFSQFRKVLNTTGDRLIRRFGTARIAEYWGAYRKQELHKFTNNDECFCMLLGKDGSEGLDLSFVTHIIFLEQVWDKSLEQQAVARAWRMGAKQSVVVETLIAENSVEETMAQLELDAELGGQEEDQDLQGMQVAVEGRKSGEYQRAKLHFLLRKLRLITNSETNPLVAAPDREKRPLPVVSPDPLPQNEWDSGKRRRVKFEM